MSSTTEVKHALRKTEFPICAKEALIKIEQFLIGRSSSIKHMDLAMDLMAEFVFAEIDRRGNRKTTALSSLQELQLLQVLCEYFESAGTEAVKNTVFLSLFGGSSLALRIKILCKLVSMSVCVPAPAVLHAAGIWMQQLGNTSAHSLQLAKSLVNDYFVFTPSAVSRLRTLPDSAPQFTANFLTAVAEIYLTDKRTTFTPPPACLLETITQWVSDNYKLCTAAQNIQSSLPSGAIQMAAITPLAGLLKWCILAPVHYVTSQYDSSSSLVSKTVKAQRNEDCQKHYAQLHLALLESLLETGPRTGPATAVCAQHLVTVIQPLQNQIAELLRLGKSISTEPALQISLDRLAQAIQVALATHCIYGNTQDLLNQLDQLPDNRLLKIVINTHKQIVI
ncbi:uncharacterized protein CBL_11160 [Carabus blaptoides fortunei]